MVLPDFLSRWNYRFVSRNLFPLLSIIFLTVLFALLPIFTLIMYKFPPILLLKKKESLGLQTIGEAISKYCSDIVEVKTTVIGGHKEILPKLRAMPKSSVTPIKKLPHSSLPQPASPLSPPRPMHDIEPRLEDDMRSFLAHAMRVSSLKRGRAKQRLREKKYCVREKE
jgi:hypothetical protein